MSNIILPNMKRNYRITDRDRLTINWAYRNIKQRSHLLNDENFTKEPFVILNDILPPQKHIPTYSAVTRNSHNKDNFQRAIGPIIILGQMFGLMPVSGVLSGDASQVRFSKFSWKTFYSIICMIGGSIMTSFCIARLYTFEISIHTVSTLIFYGSTFLTVILFFRLSRRWPTLSRAIEKEESRSAPHPFAKQRRSLSSKFRTISSIFLLAALFEHLLSIASGASMVYGCDNDNTLIVGFYYSSYPQVFSYTRFSYWKAFFLQIYNSCATFYWNFMDLFIILLSIFLSTKFEKLNNSVKAAKGKNLPEHFWKVTRNEYANLAHLVGQIDESINEFILLSFINNLYIICMQLFNSFNSAQDANAVVMPCWKKLFSGLINTMYFVVSFIFLVSRFLSVALSASRIYTTSRLPLLTLFSVGPETYCIEIQRFIDHITSDVVAFTGMKFFNITRGLILTIAGTVVTYELVLVQFNQAPPLVQANITLKECGTIEPIKPSV